MGGRPVHELLDARKRELADHLVAGFTEAIPVYRHLGGGELADVAWIIVHNLELAARIFEHRRYPDDSELEPIRAGAARRAQEGVPLEALLTAYHQGAGRVWDVLFAAADPEDFRDVVIASRLILGWTQAVTVAVCDAYIAERESMLSQEQQARHAVVSALLGGGSAETASALAGVRLSARYLVLNLEIGRDADERGPGSGAVVAGRRKLHRIRAVLEDFATEPILSLMEVGGGLVLVPIPDEPLDWPVAVRLVEDVTAAAGARLWAAGQTAGPDEIAEATRTNVEVLDVVRTFGYPPALYRLSDVLLEYQLTRPSEAMTELASLLDPLRDNPDLLRTIEVHLETGLDRRQTAARLHVHPNTVDYRLRRIVTLTGLDPVEPAHLQRIGAALAARRRLASD